MRQEVKNALIILFCYAVISITVTVTFQLLLFKGTTNEPLQTLNFGRFPYPIFIGTINTLGSVNAMWIAFRGKFVSLLAKMSLGFLCGFLLYFLIARSPVESTQIAGFYVFLTTAFASVYYAANIMLKATRQITLSALVKCGILVALGVSSFGAVFYASHSISASATVLFGFVFAGVAALFNPLRFADKPTPRAFGKLITKNTILMIVIGLLIAIYAVLGHPAFYAANPFATLIGEWLTIVIVVVVCYLYLRRKVEGISAPLIVEKWKKHEQALNFKTSQELAFITQLIDEFLQHGKKNGIVLYLTKFLFDRRVNPDQISAVLNDLINYQDANPKLFFRGDAKLITNLNLQSRNQVMSKTIENVQKVYKITVEASV
jgi:hypothetical protein